MHGNKHSDYLNGYLNFMEFQLSLGEGKLRFKKEHIESFWKLLVEEATCPEERELLFFYIMKCRESPGNKSPS